MPQQPDAIVTVRIGGTSRLEPFLPSLEELIDEIRETGNDGQITYRPPSGYGVTLYQTIMIYIGLRAADVSIGNVVTSIEGAVISWVKKQFTSDTAAGRRKKIITIYGPDNKPLKSIKADSPDEIEVTEIDPDNTKPPA